MKKLFLVIAVGLLSLSFGCGCTDTSSASHSADTLAMLADRLDSTRFPLSLGLDGAVTDMILAKEDSMMSVSLVVADDYVDSATIVNNPARREFTSRLMFLNDSVRSLLMLSRQVPVGVRINLSTPLRSNLTSFVIDRNQLRSLSMDSPSERERDEVKVNNRVLSDNVFCPYELEDGVTMVAMNVQDRYVTFHTQIDVEKLDFFVMKQNRDSVSIAVVQSLQQQLADSLTRSSLLEIARARLGYRNRYVSSDRTDSFDISFTPSDLERLIAVSDSIVRADRKKH